MHPIATFLVRVYAATTALVFVPRELTEPGAAPGRERHRCGRFVETEDGVLHVVDSQ